MKTHLALPGFALSCALSFCAIGSSSAAEPTGRDALISRITRSQMHSALLAQTGQAAASSLAFVRQANPGVSELDWKEITEEVGGLMASGMAQPGNPMFAAYRRVLEPLSDAELAALETLLADPVYCKFSHTLTSQQGQQAIIQGMIENTPLMPVTLNLVLRNRGLKEVH